MAIVVSFPNEGEQDIIVHRARTTDPINVVRYLRVLNQGTQTLYYKIVTTSADWSITSPTNGEIGELSPGASTGVVLVMQRSVPTSDVAETVGMKIQAYTDSAYTNLLEEYEFNFNAVIADFDSWTNVTKWDFDDGTWQGWTAGHIGDWAAYDPVLTDARSISAGGYSVVCPVSDVSHAGASALTNSAVAIPNNTRAVLLLYLSIASGKTVPSEAYLEIYVNDTKKLDVKIGKVLSSITRDNWYVVGLDITEYANNTTSVEIRVGQPTDDVFDSYSVYLDEITVAGTDSL